MLKHRLILAGGMLALAASCSAGAAAVADKNMIRAHLSFLADDLLEGRETGSRGYDIAARYVASQLLQYGVKPAGDKDGYLQQVPLRATRLVQESPVVELRRARGAETLAYLDDYAVGGSLLEDQSEVTAPLVFVGYGIHADRLRHNDYANLDVKGKIVVVLSGKPGSFPTEEGAHFASGDHKRSLAVQHGAVGMVTLQTPQAEKVAPFSRNKDYRHIPSMGWVQADGAPAREVATMQNRVSLSIAAAKKLFSEVDVRLDDIYALAQANRPLPRLDLPSKVDGSAQYACDIRLPNMVYASVRQGPAGDARLVRADRTAAGKVPGVVALIEQPGWIGAVATNWWAANRAVERMAPRFETQGPLIGSGEVDAALARALDGGEASRLFSRGDADGVIEGAAQGGGKVFRAHYQVGLAPSAPLETLRSASRDT